MAKKKKSMIGHDPLAWLKEEAEDAEIVEEEKPVLKAKSKKKAAKKTATKKAATKSKKTDSENIFEIQSTQDISIVAELHEELKSLIKGEKIILGGENVERIDAASLQLLYSFILEAKVNEIDVVWRSPSEALTHSAKLLGMEESLQLNNVA